MMAISIPSSQFIVKILNSSDLYSSILVLCILENHKPTQANQTVHYKNKAWIKSKWKAWI